MYPFKLAARVLAAAGGLAVSAGALAQAVTEQITVIGITPTEGAGLPAGQVPAHVRGAGAEDFVRFQSLDVTDLLNRRMGAVSINSAQNNPLQPDVQFRGFTASPLLGLPQGLAVYQDGARINEPLGDTVNWDLLPQSAVHEISVIGGGDPLYGLNSLGGALTLDMKNGFNNVGHGAQLSGGSWGRITGHLDSGGNNGAFGYYANVQYFEEDGWRDLSESDALNAYGALSWRTEASSLDLGLGYGNSFLTGNGAAPVGLIELDRAAIFTAPDITENDMQMVSLAGTHDFGGLEFAGSGFWRRNDTESFNGDASEFGVCELGNGDRLLAGLEEDDLEELDLDDDDVCEDAAFADAEALEDFLNGLAGEDEFHIEDLTDELSGTGVLADEAINNRSDRRQESYGIDLQLTATPELFGADNHLVGGAAWFSGTSTFASVTELAGLDPVTRSTRGLGVGTFVDEAETAVDTRNRSFSLYFSNTLALTDAVSISIAGRWNTTRVRIQDLTGERPELNGAHRFSRFNPRIGLTLQAHPAVNLYANYAESARAPTPIELTCNEDTFERARAFAQAAGQDPDDVEFECRLPNAFLADPPLEQVVAKGFEAGARGAWEFGTYHLGVYRTENHNDVLFQTTGRATGLFANVDKTRRFGAEVEFAGHYGALDWFANWSWVQATFRDDFEVLSPNHPFAEDAGALAVERGDRIPGIPAHTLKIGATFAVNERFQAGADFGYHAGQFLRGDEANQLDRVPGYTLLNLRARYRFTEHLEVFVRLDNVFDTDFENFGLLGEAPGEVIPALEDSAARFLGVGAPRAVWAGVRLAL